MGPTAEKGQEKTQEGLKGVRHTNKIRARRKDQGQHPQRVVSTAEQKRKDNRSVLINTYYVRRKGKT